MKAPNKEPKTPKQIAKKKAWIGFLILMVLSIAMIVVGIVLQNSAETVSAILLILGIIWFIGNFVDIAGRIKRINRSYCSVCGEKFDYDDDVAWDVDEVETTSTKQTAIVEIECHCEYCDNVDEYRTKLTIARYNKTTNSWKEQNIYNLVRKLFVK